MLFLGNRIPVRFLRIFGNFLKVFCLNDLPSKWHWFYISVTISFCIQKISKKNVRIVRTLSIYMVKIVFYLIDLIHNVLYRPDPALVARYSNWLMSPNGVCISVLFIVLQIYRISCVLQKQISAVVF
jgi:hypothetical protein